LLTGIVEPLANPYLALGLRVALGTYIIYMSRKFYADPMGYFRSSGRWIPDYPLARQIVRGLACFCLWGGCFIVASAIAAQVLDLHGLGYALLLVLLAVIAAYFLLPEYAEPGTADESGADDFRRFK
jgi:hypothetical protein